jgi:ubiquinone/menaquinone biosynthesis C-methylase UbiE
VTLQQISEGKRRNLGSPTSATERIVDFFDRRAADYDREYSEQTPAGYALRVRRRKVLELFDRPGSHVLDVGCGPGVMAEEILARGCRFWGVDPSEKMISIARGRFGGHPNARLVQGDAGRLPFTDSFFDAVLCMGVIDSVPDGHQAVQEMVRVLKPGGTLILSVANLLSPYAWWKNFGYYPLLGTWHRVRARLGDPTMSASRVRSCPLRRLYSRRSAKALIESKAARVTHVVPYYFNVFVSPLDDLMPHAALRVTQKMEEGAWRWPEWLAAGWILKARKS